jgi:hypothetical protein
MPETLEGCDIPLWPLSVPAQPLPLTPGPLQGNTRLCPRDLRVVPQPFLMAHIGRKAEKTESPCSKSIAANSK